LSKSTSSESKIKPTNIQSSNQSEEFIDIDTLKNSFKQSSSEQSSTELTPKSYINDSSEIVSESEPNNDDKEDITVYITEHGKKYHNDGCSSLSKSKIPISLDKAKELYEPCKKLQSTSITIL